jgi:hypothetical protein
MNKKQFHRQGLNKIFIDNASSTANRDSEADTYLNKYNLGDAYGAGLVRRMAKDISTVYV